MSKTMIIRRTEKFASRKFSPFQDRSIHEIDIDGLSSEQVQDEIKRQIPEDAKEVKMYDINQKRTNVTIYTYKTTKGGDKYLCEDWVTIKDI